MDILQAVFLGIIQGVTEVLPISSSGHLVLIPWIFGFQDPGLSFDVALHIGTLLAIIIYFRNDWRQIIKGFFSGLKKKQFKTAEEKLPLFIVLATIPGVLAGYFFNDLAETTFRNPLLIAGSVFVFGVVLLLAEKKHTSLSSRARLRTASERVNSTEGSLKNEGERSFNSSFQEVTQDDKKKGQEVGPALLAEAGRNDKGKGIEKEDSKSAFLTGIAQAVAIIPGVSRSGITISAGMFQGFTREAAARFSFLISAPIILGAGVFAMRKMPVAEFQSQIFWAGLISSVVASFLTVRFLMKFVKSHKLNIFAYYRFVLAGVILLIYILGS